MTTIQDRDADQLFVHYLFGQRQVLGIVDAQLPSQLIPMVENAVAEYMREQPDIEPCSMIRYLRGELTEGIAPIERLAHNGAMLDYLEDFFRVVSVLCWRADREKPRGRKKSEKLTRRDRLREGQIGPFVMYRQKGRDVVVCTVCGDEQPYDLVMHSKDECCVSCGATCHGDEDGDQGGNTED